MISSLKSRPVLSLLLLALLLLWLDLFVSRALLQGAFLHYNPINGDFQTFNPLRRMSEGQMPGRDFQPYMGLGTTYATYLPYLFLGENFSASKTASYMAHSLLFFIGNFVLLRLLGARKVISFCGSIFLFLYAYITADFLYALPFDMAMSESALPFGQTFRALATPENSCLGIRTALPLITSGILLLCYHFKVIRHRRSEAITWGLIAGMQVAWSNDYGFISAAMLVAFFNLFIAQGTWRDRLIGGVMNLLFAGLGAALIVILATGGYGFKWLHYNFGGVAKDQFWYFMLDDTGKVFDLAIFLEDKKNLLFIGFLLAVAGVICLQQLFAKHKDLRLILLAYVIGTTVAAGLVSCIGGGFMWRYFSASVRLIPFVAPWLVWLAVKRLPIERFKEPFTLLCAALTLVGGIGFIVYFMPVQIIGYQSYVEGKANGRFFYDETAGGYLPDSQKTEVEFAKLLGQHYANIPAKQRVFSTYSTLIEAQSGSLQGSDIDYIIHALGNENREQYLRSFSDLKPLYVTTPREDYTLWETWSRRVNWWFYRAMLNEFEPMLATPYHTIWQRRSTPIETLPAEAFVCEIVKHSANETSLVVLNKMSAVNPNHYYVELSITHNASVKPSWLPIIGKRGLIVVNEHRSALDEYEGKGIGSIDSRTYNAPLDSSPLVIPVEHRLGGYVSEIILRAAPNDRATLDVTGCEVIGALRKPQEPRPAPEIPAGLIPSPR